jgi:hypothetical protein
MAVDRAIQATGLPRAMIARLGNVNEATVWSWLRPSGSDAARAPSPESVRQLAAGLRAYSAKLARLADELEVSAREDGAPGAGE